jgi:hypothetical protein
MAASIVTSLRMIGMILGLAALSSWGVSRYITLVSQIKIPPGVTDVNKITAIYQTQATAIAVTIVTGFFLVGAILALVAVIPALFLWKPKAGEESAQSRVVVGM